MAAESGGERLCDDPPAGGAADGPALTPVGGAAGGRTGRAVSIGAGCEDTTKEDVDPCMLATGGGVYGAEVEMGPTPCADVCEEEGSTGMVVTDP